MRKNNQNRKKLKSLFFTTYLVEGVNLDILTAKLKRAGISLYNLKKKDNKHLLLTIKSSSNENFFAITKEMCYNIKKVNDSGKFYPLLYFYRNLGILIGALVFTATVTFSSDIIFSFDYSGTGSAYRTEVERILDSKGISTGDRFSKIDLKKLSGYIRSESNRFSFVNCTKKGNRLCIELVLSKQPPTTMTGDAKNLTTKFSGVIESVKAYRGTVIKTVGETVSEGDIIVDGYMTVGDTVVETNVIATVSIISVIEDAYLDAGDGKKDYYSLISSEKVINGEIVDSQVTVTTVNERYLYTVKTTVRRILSVG